jgi:very-short-patch-repair endonuclease
MRRQVRTHQRLASLAARQYGIVTRDQLADLGYTDNMVDHALRNGRLQAWHRNVFAVGHGGLSPHGLCKAAVMFRGESALISYQSAVWLWGLDKRLEIPVNVSVRWRGHAQSAIGLHHCPALRDEDFATTEGLPVTSVPRTLLDYASTARQYRLEFAIDRADRLDILDPAAVDRILDEVKGHRGRKRLQKALTIYRETGFTRSGGEKALLAALADAGVRRPAVNNFIEGYELDFYWEHERLAVELDSWEHHRSRRSFEEDRARQDNLAMADIETIRITGTRLKHEPTQVANRIAEHLRRRQRLAQAA